MPTPEIIRRFWTRHPWCTDSFIALLGALFAVVSTQTVLRRRRIPRVALAKATGNAALMFVLQSSLLMFGACLHLPFKESGATSRLPIGQRNRNGANDWPSNARASRSELLALPFQEGRGAGVAFDVGIRKVRPDCYPPVGH